MLAAFILIVGGLTAVLGGAVMPLSGQVKVLAMLGGFTSVAIGLFVGWIRLYVKTSANLAFVRTGSGGAKPILDGGSIVFPLIHNIIRISLETMKLDVERTGEDALITKDNLRVDVRGEFYIKVDANRDDILAAARSLGERGVNPQEVSKLVFEKLVSALRSVAATMDLVEIHGRREEFAKAVFESVREDLKHNGLTLESVTVSRLDQTDPRTLSDDNIFDAQGKKKITEITQAALVERNRLERDAERERRTKDVETRKQILALEREQAEVEATQATEVANVRAAKQREQREFAIEQDRQVQQAEIDKNRAVQEAGIQQELKVQSAGLDRDRQLILLEQQKQQTDIERQQAVETARITQEQTVEVAEREREITVAQKEALRAEAQRKALEATAAREKANQEVLTVEATSQADREAATRLIAAKQVIEQDRIKRQTDAEVEAFRQVKEAEAEQQAAEQRAQAVLRLAEAEAAAKERNSEGDQAQRMVEVNVERERVNVEAARVEVERQGLENQQTFSEAAIEFEVDKLRIAALRDVQVALAEAVGEMMSRGNFQIYGDPATMSTMLDQFSRGLGLGALTQGLIEGAPEAVRKLAGTLGETIQPVLDRMAGKNGGPAAGDGEGTGTVVEVDEPDEPADPDETEEDEDETA